MVETRVSTERQLVSWNRVLRSFLEDRVNYEEVIKRHQGLKELSCVYLIEILPEEIGENKRFTQNVKAENFPELKCGSDH